MNTETSYGMVRAAGGTVLDAWTMVSSAKEPNSWVEKLGELDTHTYPWQIALYDDFLAPFKVGDRVRFHNDELRHNFPWEEVDEQTSVVTDKLSSPRYTAEWCYTIASERGIVSTYRHKLSSDDYLPILEYFFGKGCL